MAETDTSLSAFSALNRSGKRAQVRETVIRLFNVHGPLADFEMQAVDPYDDIRSLMARRLELTKENIVGLMPYTKENPNTERECMVWGLVEKHLAVPYCLPDTIEIRVRGERSRVAFKPGELLDLTLIEILDAIETLLGDLDDPRR